MATDDPHALTARYFDGEAGADEAAALAHLETCARCQAELGDLIGFEVALARDGGAELQPVAPGAAPPTKTAAPAAATPSTTAEARAARRWWPIAAVAVAVAAAAIVLVLVRRPSGAGPAAPALALAEQRAVEVRFTAAPFAAHRPYAVARGAAGRETFALAALAGLERRGERATLAAAQASSGDLGHAREALAATAAGPGRDADLAAIELLAGQPEAALIDADRALAAAPSSTAARWNRALALRELGFGLTAARELDAVAAAGEPGWADEARAAAAAVRGPIVDRGAAAEAFTAAAEAMIDRTGPPLDAAAVRARPGFARLYFLDALRASATRAEAEALAPLAAALDAEAGTDHAGRALAAVISADFKLRAPLARAYRALVLRRAPIGEAAALVERARGQPDLQLGAIVLAGQTQQRLDELTRLAGDDPWFTLLVARERGRALVAAGAPDRAEALLRDALARCDARAWGYRCGALALDLAVLYGQATRYADAAEHAAQAMRMYAAVGATALEDHALAYRADVERGRGRLALATAAFHELLDRVPDHDCATRRFADLGLALVAVYRADPAIAVALPAPDACGVAPTGLELVAAVDLARTTGAAADGERARAWIAAARAAGDAQLAIVADVAEGRLTGALDRLRAAVPALAPRTEEEAAVRAWGAGALVDASAAEGWPAVIAAIAADTGVAAPATCALAVSVDRTRGVAVAIGPDGAVHGRAATVAAPDDWTGPRLVPDSLSAVLVGCASVSVLARPPVHGRADLLPAALPWAFVGAPQPPPPAAPPREVIVGDARPPAALGLPALAPVRDPGGATLVRGAAATPAAVLAALADATYAELHVHGEVDLEVADASFLALSPGPDERWALTAADVRAARFAGAPVIVLAACRAAQVAPYLHARWSLPDAFLAAGARAVIAPTVEIPDDQAVGFFDALRRRLATGEDAAAALAALRRDYLARGATWTAGVVLFR